MPNFIFLLVKKKNKKWKTKNIPKPTPKFRGLGEARKSFEIILRKKKPYYFLNNFSNNSIYLKSEFDEFK